MQSKKVIILDLDGTLSKVNTFTLFVKVFFRMSAVSRLNLTGIVLARKLRFISHAGAKQRIVSLFRRKGDGAIIEKTVEKIVANIRHDLLRIALASDLSVLATAAPSLYARTLAERLGFGDVVATPPEGPECRGEGKVAMLRRIGVDFSDNVTVYTDHHDDLPLLEVNSGGINILVNPSDETISKISELRNLSVMKIND